jgi:hypothetical protein
MLRLTELVGAEGWGETSIMLILAASKLESYLKHPGPKHLYLCPYYQRNAF